MCIHDNISINVPDRVRFAISHPRSNIFFIVDLKINVCGQ